MSDGLPACSADARPRLIRSGAPYLFGGQLRGVGQPVGGVVDHGAQTPVPGANRTDQIVDLTCLVEIAAMQFGPSLAQLVDGGPLRAIGADDRLSAIEKDTCQMQPDALPDTRDQYWIGHQGFKNSARV